MSIDTVWIPQSEAVEIQGIRLRGPHYLVPHGGGFAMGFAIADDLKASAGPLEFPVGAEHLTTYRDWEPTTRSAYLRWMESNRSILAHPPGSFLRNYFLNLEHAIVIDGVVDPGIFTEFGELLVRNHEALPGTMLRTAITNLFSFFSARLSPENFKSFWDRADQLPGLVWQMDALAVRLAKHLVFGLPVPDRIAVAVCRLVGLKTVTERDPGPNQQTIEEFLKRVHKQFPQGIKLTAPKTLRRIGYRASHLYTAIALLRNPASWVFEVRDVMSDPSSVAPLLEIWQDSQISTGIVLAKEPEAPQALVDQTQLAAVRQEDSEIDSRLNATTVITPPVQNTPHSPGGNISLVTDGAAYEGSGLLATPQSFIQSTVPGIVGQPMEQQGSLLQKALVELNDSMQRALRDEVEVCRNDPRQGHTVRDGRLIRSSNGSFVYVFQLSYDIAVPDDCPAKLLVGGSSYEVVVISTEQLSVHVRVSKSLGDRVPRAVLKAEPWFLLLALSDRLKAICDPKSGFDPSLVLKVFGLVNPAHHTPAVFHNNNDHLNAEQKNAIDHVLAWDVTDLQGPPGTGKTSTAGEAVAAIVQQGGSAFCTAHTHAATDCFLLATVRAMAGTQALENGEVVRFGVSRSQAVRDLPDVQPLAIAKKRHPELFREYERLAAEHSGHRAESIGDRLRTLHNTILAAVGEVIDRAKVVFTTISQASVSDSISLRRFDFVLVDECTMATLPQIAFVSALARKGVVLCGDCRQLGPIFRAQTQAAKDFLGRDIFLYSGIEERINRRESDERLVMLQVQYRMHSGICALVNRTVYNGILVDGPNIDTATAAIVNQAPEPGNSVIFYDIGPAQAKAQIDRVSKSHFNPVSALLSFGMGKALVERGVENLAFLTPYNKQAGIYRALALDTGLPPGVLSSTIHRLQGGEVDAVVLDLTDSYPLRRPGVLLQGEFGSSAMRILNVALSRPRAKLIVIADREFLLTTLSEDSILREFMAEMLRSHVPFKSFSFHEMISDAPDRAGVSFYSNQQKAWQQIYADLAAARDSTIINWPTPNFMEVFSGGFVSRAIPPGIRIILAGPVESVGATVGETHGIRIVEKIGDDFLIQVDRHTLWILAPQYDDQLVRPFIRIKGEKAPRRLAELLGLEDLLETPTRSRRSRWTESTRR